MYIKHPHLKVALWVPDSEKKLPHASKEQEKVLPQDSKKEIAGDKKKGLLKSVNPSKAKNLKELSE